MPSGLDGSLLCELNRGRSHKWVAGLPSPPSSSLGIQLAVYFRWGAAPSEGPEVGRAKIAGLFLPEVESGCSQSGGEAELRGGALWLTCKIW